ncbi:unnamed protein product [Ectocarpus sp. CCAP 1310/34]|nr:unnamed protein product [Ectocarpus sp. CCAP 1310/34]
MTPLPGNTHGVGVEADPALARELYRRSGSTPALLGLWMMGASDLALEIGAPRAVSAVRVAATMLAMRLLGKRHRGGSGRRHRQPVQVGAAAAVAGGRGRGGRGRGGGGGGPVGGSALLIEREGDEEAEEQEEEAVVDAAGLMGEEPRIG